MNPSNLDKKNPILAKRFKQELQNESTSWNTPNTMKLMPLPSSPSLSLRNENDKIVNHLNILDKTNKIFGQKQGDGNEPVFPSTPMPPHAGTSLFPFSSLLEPTPFGPQGIQPQNVVDEIPLIKSGKLLLEKNHKDQREIFIALSPLLLTQDDGNFYEKKQYHHYYHPHQTTQISSPITTYQHNDGDITTANLSDRDNTTITGTFQASSFPTELFPMHAHTTDENCCDTTKVFVPSSHSFNQKFQPSEEVHPSSEICTLRTATNTTTRYLSKKRLRAEQPTFSSSPEITTLSSRVLRNQAVIFTSDDDISFCTDKRPHNQEQLNHQYDSLPLMLSEDASDSSCSIGDSIATNSNTTIEMEIPDERRFRSYQCDQWKERFQDLIDFKEKHGHCLVPYEFPRNQPLALWIKRQRYQYKLKNLGRHSTLTDERQSALEQIGFIWDSHKATWTEHFESLKEFKTKYGYCLVPSDYPDHSLAIWVKSQRRQYKLFLKGCKSAMTRERFVLLDTIGFDWNPRNL